MENADINVLPQYKMIKTWIEADILINYMYDKQYFYALFIDAMKKKYALFSILNALTP